MIYKKGTLFNSMKCCSQEHSISWPRIIIFLWKEEMSYNINSFTHAKTIIIYHTQLCLSNNRNKNHNIYLLIYSIKHANVMPIAFYWLLVGKYRNIPFWKYYNSLHGSQKMLFAYAQPTQIYDYRSFTWQYVQCYESFIQNSMGSDSLGMDES